ncbi:tRNA pseudouridine(55) synthase TruB [Candidatus Bealeia paramacronuclearis]|uniref:tRNA pseudouridine synthase B n=1 Tax=Candidatus Bealeia paramacronuclearis TaxID=1921001 RepID=A0ABZ2C339_9PROT|nr:tRNA pseudouridine(55) synthase TruB [Candidatus Bealeia paramacronuclearis]
MQNANGQGGRNVINGWVLIDKPVGLTSTDVVTKLKRKLRPQKIGHAGTLDPFATGLLPLALGEATKVISFGMDGLKTYQFTLKFGEETTTEDTEGEVTRTSPVRLTGEDIAKILPEFLGHLQQIPPAYSALKIQGKRAYELARAGAVLDLPPREIYIESLRLLSQNNADEFQFEVICGKGTYVRSLGRDIARKLGSWGHLIQLRRTQVGPFLVQNAFLLDSYLELGHKAEINNAILPLQSVLDDILAVEVLDDEARRLRQGQSISRPNLSYPEDATVFVKTQTSEPLGLALYHEGALKPYRIFNI